MTDVPPLESLADPAAYPRIYRASGGWLVALTLCGLLFVVGGAIGAWSLAAARHGNPQARFWLVSLCLAITAFGIYCLLSTFRSRVVLFVDRIEVEELTHTRVLSRDEIRGWRSVPTTPSGFAFIPKETGRRKITVALLFPIDTEFAQWICTLPCLDADDRRTSKAEIRNNARLGATPGERMKVLARGRRLALALAIITSLTLLWGFFYPRPYELVITVLMMLPWAAVEIVRRSSGLFRIDRGDNGAHPQVAGAFMLPGMALALRSTLDYNIVYSPSAAWLSIGIGSLLCLSAVLADSSLRRSAITIILLLAISLAYGYGTTVEANVLLDHSTGASCIASVEGKRIIKGKRTTYELELGPWGPKAKSNKLAVARATYDAIGAGDVACLTLKQGALGVNWYFMRAWQHRDAVSKSECSK